MEANVNIPDSEFADYIKDFCDALEGIKDLTPKQQEFLVAYVHCGGIVRIAAKAIGINIFTHYKWRNLPGPYKAVSDKAEEMAKYTRLHEAYRRAVAGVSKPVFYKGEVVGTVQEYSDSLMQTIIKGDFPEQYGDKDRNLNIKHDIDDAVLSKLPGRERLSDAELDAMIARGKELNEQRRLAKEAAKVVNKEDSNEN